MFGHQISMNFNDQQASHKTIIGGMFTVITYVIIIIMVVFKVIRIFTNGNPDLNSIVELSPEGLLEDHKFTDMNILPFYILKKQTTKERHVMLDTPNLDEYLDIYFSVETADYTLYNKPGYTFDNIYTRKYYKAVKCTREHFGHTEAAKTAYKIWEKYSTVCLPIEAANQLYIQGDLAADKTKNLLFHIDMCKNSTRKEYDAPCQTREVIYDYI